MWFAVARRLKPYDLDRCLSGLAMPDAWLSPEQNFARLLDGCFKAGLSKSRPRPGTPAGKRPMNVTFDLQYFRTILESLPVATYVVDRERRILLWNRQAEKISGFLGYEVIGRSCRDDILMHCDRHGTVLCGEACPLAGTMHDGQAREVHIYMRHKKGHRVPVRVHAVPVRNEDGSIVGAAEVFEEIPTLPERVLDRASVESLLRTVCADYAERKVGFGVLLIHIEGLPRLDKMYGRQAEETIMAELTATLARCMGSAYYLGRWSDNRLLAIIRDCMPGALADIKETLQELLARTTVPWWGDQLKIAVRVSVAEIRDGDSPESLVARCEETVEADS